MRRLVQCRNYDAVLRLRNRFVLEQQRLFPSQWESRALTTTSVSQTYSNVNLLSTPVLKRPRVSCFTHGPGHRCLSTYVSKYFRVYSGEVEKYLERMNLKFRRTNTHAVVEECPFCHDTKGKADNLYKLYLCLESGVYMCHRCEANGSWYTFQKRLSHGVFLYPCKDSKGAEPGRSEAGKIPPVAKSRRQVLPSSNTQRMYQRDLWGDLQEVKRYINEKRRLEDRVLRKYGVGAAVFKVEEGGRWIDHACVTFPMYNEEGKLVRHKVRSIKTKSYMRLQPKGGGWGLFGIDTVPADAKEVVLTEGEFDAMAVYQMTGRPAISLPNGASSLPIQLLPALERFEKIILWMDKDLAGQNGAKQFSRKLGLKRCTSVITEDCKDANDGLLKNLDLNQVLCSAKVVPHEEIVTFDDLREEVFYEFSHSKALEGLKCKSLPLLNSYFSGLRNGELTIYSGHTGIGKTTLLSQLSLDYCLQGMPTLWGSFEVGNVRLAGRLLKQLAGAHGKSIMEGKENYDLWADKFAELPMYFMTYHGSIDIQQVIDAMDYANYVYDCSHIVLDNLQFMTSTQGYGRDRFAVQDHAVSEIRDFCTKRHVHVSLVVHPRKEDDDRRIMTASVFGSAKATQEADNLIVLQRANETALRSLDVMKNRFNGNTGQVKLRFDREKHLYVETGTSAELLRWGRADGMRMRPRDKVQVVFDDDTRTRSARSQTRNLRCESMEAESKVCKTQQEEFNTRTGHFECQGDARGIREMEGSSSQAMGRRNGAVPQMNELAKAGVETKTMEAKAAVFDCQYGKRDDQMAASSSANSTTKGGDVHEIEASQSEARSANFETNESGHAVRGTAMMMERLLMSVKPPAACGIRSSDEVEKPMRERRKRNNRVRKRRRATMAT